ncbi:adenosylcobinamide-phosphate synthase CbiB [Leptospira borgpetersenii]|uniref:adenosylcobinamide-phosphate synthase CbiB n=1 Tax=Leptospira borgpetersenii TaxID=174 RepID=UPI00077328D1|nr:adenosylcobinamide-phosphate synthase CbiB [Leptospira borgpetersenii]MBE8364842.1 cobalamin biosynthesis protein [Leptospira borgpetersenii serovar Balcanica]MBE8366510.1 cobalamin biosynthesis protein [Leptospira borgpetersenii serovar Balcanica]MBE8399321.1 cobalamin biosynthesis protein [Leptospira borgpetersenii serovar Tarassovi]MBE8402493.1 cobalamin biosynthesis protein [Leptospira borgpetersenii serovar Tarassovi]MBE8405642.1 cobalamin biosynthesis protein [Leptospira borgpeterseni
MPWIITLSIVLDLIFGDPRNTPHPVRVIGKFARISEKFFRAHCNSERFAGILTSCCVYTFSFSIPFFLIQFSNKLHWILASFFSITTIYTTIAIRDMIDHSKEVYDALAQTNLSLARVKVSRIVARDTKNLNQPEIIRACVESIAESLVDGITAPLFYAVFGGPSWAMFYRSINTLDSLFGYKNNRYRKFGSFPARMDDLANYLPARITCYILVFSSLVLGYNFKNSLYTLHRDGRKHPSPNSGLTEAAVAGALEIQLGGINFYNGIQNVKPKLGDNKKELRIEQILQANKLVLLSSILTAGFYVLIYSIVVWLWEEWKLRN